MMLNRYPPSHAVVGRQQILTTTTKIRIAVGIGVIVGTIFSFRYPQSVSSSSKETHPEFDHPSNSTPAAEVDWGSALKQENEKLKLKVLEQHKMLKLIEQIKGDADKKGSRREKAGPFGTVKGVRTNPSVLADEATNPRLAKLLKGIAVRKELIVALANSNVMDMLELWVENIKRVGIKNYLVVALDDTVAEFCNTNGVPSYVRDPDKEADSIGKTGSNHAVSGLKFRVLREFLQLGYAVLLSDVDIVFLQNPFDFLYRDSDVESMSDGHDNATTYGFDDVFDDPVMGWGRYAHTMRIWVYNSGFFYIRPTMPAIELLDRVTNRLALENGWDQAVFNQELFIPSHPGYEGLHASKRTMDMYLFMNSKMLFKTVRNDERLRKVKPVIVHLNYQANKFPRMKAVMDFYVNGTDDDLMSLEVGS